jgi:membrane fusion protein, multidrug efflux system
MTLSLQSKGRYRSATCRKTLPRPIFAIALAFAIGLATAPAGLAADTARPVAVTVQRVAFQQTQFGVELTGAIAAQNVSEVGFRISGRIQSREVDVGDRVAEGHVLARLDADVQKADVFAAEAGVQSADATFRQREADYQRQVSLLEKGVGTQALVDDAQEQVQAAAAVQMTTRANLGIARDSLANTVLRAPITGVVTARQAEAGQVVEAAETVYTIAEDGERDAVFDVYEALLTRPLSGNRVDIRLVADPSVTVAGTVREVSPVIDAGSGTVRVKVGLPQQLPAGLSLGSPVTGMAQFDAGQAVSVPWSALSRENGKPAVWVLDPATNRVSARDVSISSYRSNAVLIATGLRDGEMVVTTGIPFLKAGITVEPRIEGEKG